MGGKERRGVLVIQDAKTPQTGIPVPNPGMNVGPDSGCTSHIEASLRNFGMGGGVYVSDK